GARVGLGPEIARVGRVAPEFEADQVILLEVGERAGLAVLPHLPALERVRVVDRRADRRRPAVTADRRADVRLRHARVENSRRAYWVGENRRRPMTGLREEQHHGPDDEKREEYVEGPSHSAEGRQRSRARQDALGAVSS